MVAIDFSYAGSVGKAKTVTDVGVIYDVQLGGGSGPVIGRVAKRHGDGDYWYATPGVASPLVTTNGVRHGFRTRYEASVWLAGAWDIRQSWMERALDASQRKSLVAGVVSVVEAVDGSQVRRSFEFDNGGCVVTVRLRNGLRASIRVEADGGKAGELLVVGPGADDYDIENVTDGSGLVRFAGFGELGDILTGIADLDMEQQWY